MYDELVRSKKHMYTYCILWPNLTCQEIQLSLQLPCASCKGKNPKINTIESITL